MATAVVRRGCRGWCPRRAFVHLGIFVRDKLCRFLLGNVQRVVRRRQETLVLGHGQQALLLRLTCVVLVLDGLMLRRIPTIILPIAIPHGNARRRRGSHRRTLPRPAGQCSRIITASAANSRLTSAANHAGVMLLLRWMWRLLRLLLLQTVILRRMMMQTVATAAGSHHRRE